MAEAGAHLIALRRLDSQVKRDQVMAALAGYVERGEATTIVGLARRAGVSARFIYNHPDLRAEIERRAAEIGGQLAGAMVASARVTTASLRAELANYKAEVQRQRTEITVLRDRLSEDWGRATQRFSRRRTASGSLRAGTPGSGSPSWSRIDLSYTNGSPGRPKNWRRCAISTGS